MERRWTVCSVCACVLVPDGSNFNSWWRTSLAALLAGKKNLFEEQDIERAR